MTGKAYRLVPSKRFLKDLENLPSEVKTQVAQALVGLKADPFSGRNTKKLAGVGAGAWRLRIGDWRLRYDIAGKDIQLHVIAHRKDVYRRK